MWYGKTCGMSYELRVTSWKLQSTNSNPRVQESFNQ